MLTWVLNLISQKDNFSYTKEAQSVSQRDKCAETGDTWQCEILNTRILAAAAAAAAAAAGNISETDPDEDRE